MPNRTPNVPRALGNFATEDGHFRQSLIDHAAQGHDTSTINAQHLKACASCQERVAKARDEYILQEASLPPNGDSAIPPDKNRINKMGTSSRRYLASISTRI